MNRQRLEVGVAAISLASIVASGIGVSSAGASSSKFCSDYKHAAKVSTLKEIKAAIPELKKLANEAPGSMPGEIRQFVVDIQDLVNNKGKFSSKSQESAFDKLSDKLESQTNKFCK